MTLMTATIMAFTSCGEDPTPTPPVDDPTPQEKMTVVLEVLDITRGEVIYNATPSDLEADYAVVVYPASVVEKCATDEEIVDKIYTEIETMCENAGKVFADVLAEMVVRGAVENATIDGLVAETNYYLLAFGVDAASNYALTTDIAKAKFKTEAAPASSSCTFEIRADVYCNTASLDVTPSDLKQMWHLINVDVETFTNYTSEDGGFGWTAEEFFQNALSSEHIKLKEEGLSDEEIARELYYTGVRTLSVSNLKPRTKYVAMVAAVTIDEEGAPWVTSTPSQIRYNAVDAAANDLSFDIDVFNIDHYSAEIRITPSNPDAEYYYYIGYINAQKKKSKPIDLANSAVLEWIYYWENYTELKHRDPVKGVTDLTGENKVELNIAETEYYVVAFSYELNPDYGKLINEETGEYDSNPGTITSAPVYVAFMTSEQGDPATAEFEFKGTDVGPYDFYLEISASDPTIYYQPGVAFADSFDPQVVMNEASTLLAQIMQMCMEGQSPSLTYQEALEERCSAYYRNGDGKYYIANLYPERDYIGYVLLIDGRTGKFVRCVQSDVIASTKPVGKISPSIELLGVYNGDEENGSIFGDADITTGRPIVAVKHSNFDGASALYGQISEGDATNASEFTDQRVISDYLGYWQEVNLNVPYSFYVAEWDIDQTAVAYALDANGDEGQVGRLLVKPVTPGDINELKGYVDELNAALEADKQPEASALSCSMVYSDSSVEPSIECLWSEEVGAPAAGKVIRREVQPLTVEGDIATLRHIYTLRY